MIGCGDWYLFGTYLGTFDQRKLDLLVDASEYECRGDFETAFIRKHFDEAWDEYRPQLRQEAERVVAEAFTHDEARMWWINHDEADERTQIDCEQGVIKWWKAEKS